MQVPAYWLLSPEIQLDRDATQSFDRLLDQALARGPAHPIDYRLDIPKWRFLCHAANRGDVVRHGSGNPDIERFEPRRPADPLEFSNRHAVFAATDGIWPMYYAILDRDEHRTMMMVASSIRVESAGRRSAPHHFFSISRPALERRPWRSGTVYLLPADSFEDQPPIAIDDALVHITEAASPLPVEPAAKLTVHPTDFPFLDRIRGHDDDLLTARMSDNPAGFPWIETS